MMNHITIFPILLPLVAGILLLLLPDRLLALKRSVSLISVLLQFIVAGLLLNTVNSGEILVYALGNWLPPFGIVLVADQLAAGMLATTALVVVPKIS